MGVSIYARKGGELLTDIESVDMNYSNFYGLMEELSIEPKDEGGTLGEIAIVEFRDCLEANWNGMYPEHSILLLKLCRLGIEQGADSIQWA